MSLSTAPYLHVLLCNFTYQPRLLGLWPPSTFFVVYSASNPDAGWSRVAYVDKLPLVVRLPCLSSEVFSRTLRVCVFARQGGTGGRELGTCSVAIRDLLDPARISGGSGGGGPLMAPVEGSSVSAAGKGRARERVGMLEVRGVVATGRAGEGLHIIVRAGISMRKEMRSCLLRVWRVGGGRQTVQLGEGRCASGVFEDVVVERDVLWFGLGESDAPNAGVRLEFRGGSRRLWTAGRDRDVLGTVELSMERLRKLRERDVVPVAWRGGGGMRCLVVDAVDVGGGLASLQMTLTR